MPEATIRAHQEWLGLIQPVGLVVVPSALIDAGIIIEESERARWSTYCGLFVSGTDKARLELSDFTAFANQVLEWDLTAIAGSPNGPAMPAELTVALPELQTHLVPTYAVPDAESPGTWQFLVKLLPAGTDLDRSSSVGTWSASPHDQFERLLRETGVGVGVIANERTVRLVYAPRGESSGYLSFPVSAMATVAGRPMFLAMVELLKWWRLSRACPRASRLGAVLRESRKYQNTVSNQLAAQVLEALYHLMRGFQSADEAAEGRVVQETLRHAPQEVYGGFLTTIMRLVFVLYAEERGMLPQDAAWVEHYGVGGLYHKLSQDRARFPDTMDQRFGAWARLLTLSRILHDGAHHGSIRIPARAGELFDPDRYPLLEGRPWGSRRVMGERLSEVPRVSDGAVLRVLEQLLVLDGERLSYRALDVEQIGSVYEAMMGFEVRAALGYSIAVIPKTKAKGSPSHPVCDLDALLRVPGKDRAKWLKDACDCEVPAAQATQLKQASSIEGLLEALQRRVSPFTPLPVRPGGLTLQPTEERRRSGSHYTPRELTEPIVATTLRPVFEALGKGPTADQILALNVCDPAMGSGAFLVGACRYLGDALVQAWQRAGATPAIPSDEDPQLFARRLVAQRCLYGVDRNPYAVQLAKLSLWLVTLAREHPFSFLDHALRHGDSLVGLTRRQIQTFHWAPGGGAQPQLWSQAVDERLREADALRDEIEALAESDDTREKQRLLRDADGALRNTRVVGDAVIAAFFGADRDRRREGLRQQYEQLAGQALAGKELGRLEELAAELRSRHLVPFHWEIEFPEVFAGATGGFDAIIGNPPFAGKNTLISGNPEQYLPWLQELHEGAHGNADLVAHFFRRAFGLLRPGGAFGLIATNTIAQGDTRATGLRWLRNNGCTLYEARRRYKWPGVAAVVVSVVHGVRGKYGGVKRIDGVEAQLITAFLFHRGSDEDPATLPENAGRSFQGAIVLGMGFTFDDTNPEATPIAEMQRLIAENPRNQEVIFPYIGGEEVNDSPTHAHRRYVINFGEMAESEVRAGWPNLMDILERKVRPERATKDGDKYPRMVFEWWKYWNARTELSNTLAGLQEVLGCCRVSQHLSFARMSAQQVFADSVVVVAVPPAVGIAVLQSRPHELWTRFFGSSMKDDLRYTPTDCFETFPFPPDWQDATELKRVGNEYHEYRAKLMVSRGQGLTDTYNRFHDPADTSAETQRLRELHDEMDRAVLEAYGWSDLDPAAGFIPEFDEDEIEPGARARRKYRLRWPDEVRDEVLARLLELNRQRSTGQH
jgi:hypothetical protein